MRAGRTAINENLSFCCLSQSSKCKCQGKKKRAQLSHESRLLDEENETRIIFAREDPNFPDGAISLTGCADPLGTSGSSCSRPTPNRKKGRITPAFRFFVHT